jgi:hypothetical protein
MLGVGASCRSQTARRFGGIFDLCYQRWGVNQARNKANQAKLSYRFLSELQDVATEKTK